MSNKEAASVLDELLKSPVEDRPPTSALSSAVQQQPAAILTQPMANVASGLPTSQQQQAVLTTVNGTPLIKTEGQNSLAVTVAQRIPAVTRVVSRQTVGTVPVATVPRPPATNFTRPVAIAPRPTPHNPTLTVSAGVTPQLQPVSVTTSNQMAAAAAGPGAIAPTGVTQTGLVAGVATADVPGSMMTATRRFLNALVDVAQKQTPEYGKMISDLVRQLLDGRLTVDQFVTGLGESEGVAEILPVLKVGVPLLRHDLQMLNRRMIEQPGIQKQAQQPILVTVSNPNQIPVAFQPTIKTEAVSTTPQQTLQNQVSVVQAQPPMSGTVLVPTATATTEQLLLQPKQQLPQQMQQQQLQQQQLQQHLQTQLQTQQLKTQTLQTLTPPSAKSSSSRQGQILVGSKRSVTPVASGSTVGTKSTVRVKGKASSAKDAMVASEGGPVRMEDDDIMDVTSMAGVNLMEETAQMAASVSTLSGMTRSVKDDSFLSPDCLQQRVNEIGLKYGVEQISPEVYTLLSHAVEERLKNLIERLITVSQHRLEIHQEESRCEVACDVKSQLKIFERIDKFHVNQRKEREREMLLKAAKSRSKQDDAELAVLKEKAKQMQQEELEQMQKRAANQTALQAIGQRKKPKIDFSNLDGSDTSSLSNPAGSVSVRAQARKTRPRRINLRDLIFILEQDKETRRFFNFPFSRSNIFHWILLCARRSEIRGTHSPRVRRTRRAHLSAMAVNPRTLALSYISYLVSNLNKKNYKSSIAELADLVEKYGFDADRHLFRWLLSYVDLSTDGKQSGGKDFHQVQLLIQEAGALITKPYCASVVCYGLESPELKSLRASGLLFQQLSRVLRLTRVQEAVFGIGLLKSSDPELRTEASQFLKNKLPDLLRSYTDIDVGSGQEGGLNDIAIEVLHLLLSHLLQSPSDEVGVHAEQLSAFVTALRRDFPRERVPVVLSPLLYPGDRDIAQDKLLPESAITGPSRMAQLELCDILREMGYHSTSSHDLLSDLIRQVDSEGLTPLCVAKCVGLMVRTHTGLSDQVPLQSLAGPSSPLWEKEKPQELPATATTWMTDIFVDVVKEQAPHLNWQEVMVSLDHPGFVVKDVDGLRVILSVYRRATSDLFPVQILYRVWNNMEGQLSWIKIGVSGVAEFSFGDYIWRAVKVDALKTPPDQENRQIMTWMSLELIETLMLLAESGQYDPVLPLFNYPIKHCPDILMLAILQVKPRWNTLQLELFNQLLPIFLASHQSNANALGVLQFAWNSTHMASIVRPQMLQGMADWYMKGEPFDQARLMRILDLAHELKALSLLLNGTRFQFVIDLAVLAAQREFLKLDKWMTDRIKEHQEAFITACAIYLKQRTSQVDKLPPEIVTSMLTVLQICQIPPSSETAEIIHALLEEYGPVMPRIRPSQLLLQQPPHAKGFDPFVAPGVRVQPGLPINPVAPTVVSSSVTQPAFPPGQQPLTFSGGNVPPEQSKPTPSQTPSTLPPTSGQTTLPAIDPQLLAQRPNLMGGTLPITDSFSSGLLSSLQHSQHTQQAGQPSRLPAQTPTSVRQDAIPGMDHSFVKEIEDEANSYFQKIYNRMMTLDEVLETLKVFKGSTNQKEKDVYLCMLRNLFEEYRFFPHYPEKELRITGSLFGGLIEHSLVTYMFLGTALRYVLEALKKQPGTNMHLFGIAALDKFRSRLKEYPQYCQHVAAIPHFSEFPARLIQCVEYGQQSRDPPIRPAQPLPPPVAPAASVPSITKPVVTATAVQPPKTTVTKPASTSPIEVTATQTQPVPAPKTTGPSIANTTNIDTLLMAVDPMPSFSIPAEDIQEKVGFIFNNMTLQNLPQKSDEVKDLIEDKHWKWLAHYLVLKRVPIEPNYHATYVAFIELHREGEFEGFALLETFRNIKVLLHSSKGDSGFTDRSLLKNLGHWLGLLTLARNIPILQKDIAMKHLLMEAYNKGVQEMLYVVPFVAKALEACAHKSSIFKPPNPWTMAILGVLVEIYKLPNIKLNLKFEVEVLCKSLSVEWKDVKTKGLLSNAEKRRFTQLSPPSDTSASPVTHQPTYYYTDINVTALVGLKDHLQINGDLALFQAHPVLKQYVRPSVERAVQELINPVVERSIKIAATTTEHILKKDFALDPEEGRMRMAAHHMVRHLTAGMAMITCREPLCMSISNNLKQAFNRYLMSTNDMQKQMIEKAADAVAFDNTEVACAFVQKTAMEKAVPDMDKRLADEFELRKMARTEGRRYCNHKILTYQAERMPEPLRHKVGGVTSQQARVYEEFANCVPGFLPPKQPPTKITQGYPADEVLHVLEKCSQELQQELNVTPAPPSNSHVMAMHVLYDTLQQVLLMRGDAASALLLLQKAMEGLLEGMAQQLADKDLAIRFRDCHLLVLRGLQDPRAYGPVWASKHCTRMLLESREEIKFNVEAVDLLVRSQLINIREFDVHMSQAMEHGLNFAAVTFCMRLARVYFIEEKHDCPISQGDVFHILETLARLAANARHPPEGLTSLLEVVRVGRDQVDVSYGTNVRLLSSGGGQQTPSDFDDPPGLHEKVEYLLTEWVRLYHQPISSRDSEKLYAAYLGKLHQHGMLKSDDLISRFFRISTEMCVELCYRNLNLSEHRMNNPSLARAKCYHTMDAYVKLIVVLVKHSGDPTNTVTKINLLNKVLSTVSHVLVQDHEVRRTEFQQLPYHRLLVMLLQELNVPDPIFDTINFQVLQSFSNTFHNLRPARASGFAFAWLELASHRTMIGKLLQTSPQQKGWGLYQQLLLDLFRFLAPFLRNAELAKSTQLLYRGTLRLLLVLLHDFPEFLCDYHFSFCDVIPPNCIQMRNLILSAFPRNMRLPDPFTPNLKVDLLTDITHAPRILTNISAAIQPGTFKKDLDSYIKTRAPVTFLSELRTHLQTSIEPGTRYNVSLLNALVLYVGMQAIVFIHSQRGTPSSSTITHSSHMDIFQNLAVDLDTEGRYLFLNAVANQLRYPNSHTHYFSCVLLYLFAEANSEAIQEQITRVLLERLIVNRPHPWGLLITFIELIRNHQYKFWSHQFVHCAPEIEKLFESVARSCMQQKQGGQPLTREEMTEA